MLIYYNLAYVVLQVYYFVHHIILWVMACRKHDDCLVITNIEDKIGADINVRPRSPVINP